MYKVQVGVIGDKSMRDDRRQSRIVRGNADGLQVHFKKKLSPLKSTLSCDKRAQYFQQRVMSCLKRALHARACSIKENGNVNAGRAREYQQNNMFSISLPYSCIVRKWDCLTRSHSIRGKIQTSTTKHCKRSTRIRQVTLHLVLFCLAICRY